MKKITKKPDTFAFIDASNIIYGTRDEGWRVDFEKLFHYLRDRYGCKKIYYFAGQDDKNIKQDHFYKLLKKIGFELVLKPVKIYIQSDGKKVRKANCDVDLTFYVMKELSLFKRIILFSGDGDFEILLKYLLEKKKEVLIFANSSRTAREIKTLKGLNFNDLRSLKHALEFK